jgi:Beta-glucosidase-related glycosidases
MIKRIAVSLLTFLLIGLNTHAVTPRLMASASKDGKLQQWVDSVFSTMTFEEKIGQLFMITADVNQTKAYQERLANLVKNQKIGGVLFSKATVEGQAKLTNFLQSQARIPLLISLDGEWGLSMRIEGTTRFPKNIALGAGGDLHSIYEYGRLVGQQCKAMGIHINFAPVLDINNNPNNPVINVRSFGENRQKVTNAALAYARGLESVGIISVGKHFPGHGDTSIDSHLGLPTVNLSLARLDSLELYPFKKYIQKGYSGMMVGHLYLPAIDEDTIPASLSHNVVTDLLKDELAFDGLVFSDALVMKAIVQKGESPCVKALLAGIDVLLSPANPVEEFNAVRKAVENGTIKQSTIEEKCKKILAYKYVAGLNEYKPIDLYRLTPRLNSREADLVNRKLTKKSLTLLSNKKHIIPIKDLDQQRIAVLALGEENTTFQNISKNYAETTLFSITDDTKQEKLAQIIDNLKQFDVIIVGVYTDRSDYPARLKQITNSLGRNNQMILTFFTSPYKLEQYEESVAKARGVLLAYENTVLAGSYSMQLLFGGVEAEGVLPVTADSLYAYGAGQKSEKCRLSYDLPETVGMNSQKLNLIDTVVNDAIRNQAIPGCQVLVAKDGVVVFNKSYGYFDYAKTHEVTNSDLYDLASVTKAAATVPAMMLLYDQDKYVLRDKLGRFIPGLKGSDKANITVRDALFHQSGLPAYLPFSYMLFDPKSYKGDLISDQKTTRYPVQVDDDAFAPENLKFNTELVSETPEPNYTVQVADHFYLNPVFHTEMMQRLLKTKLGSKEKYVYSDLNFMLLRMMVENISGQKLDTFVTKNLYSKLGASSLGYLPLTRFDKLRIAPTENDQFFRHQLIIGYPHDETAALAGGVEGNAGLFSNANDLAKLCQMWLNEGNYGGEQLISGETCRMFTQMKSSDSRRGLGFDKPNPVKPSNGPTSDSAPLSTYGHTGFTGTCFWVDPDNKLIYIFLSNRVYPHSWNKKLSQMDTRTLIQEAIYKAMVK